MVTAKVFVVLGGSFTSQTGLTLSNLRDVRVTRDPQFPFVRVMFTSNIPCLRGPYIGSDAGVPGGYINHYTIASPISRHYLKTYLHNLACPPQLTCVSLQLMAIGILFNDSEID